MIFLIALSSRCLTLFLLAVVDEVLDEAGHKGYAADCPDAQENGNDQILNELHRSAPLRQEIVIQIGGEIVSSGGLAAQRLTVTNLLDIAQAAGNTAVTVGIESVEVDGDAGITAGVDLVAIQDGLDGAANDLGSGGAVGVDEVGTLVGLVLALHITVSQGELQSGLIGDLATELGDTFLDGGIHSGIDGGDGLGIAFGDDEGNGILGGAAIDAGGLPDIGVGQTDDAGDDLGGCFLIASFRMDRFMSALRKSKDDKLLIVDEAHRFSDRPEELK